MRFHFKKKKLEMLYLYETGVEAYPQEVIERFFEAMTVIEVALDERDLWAQKGFNYHKLEGKRAHQHALRLNKQWRLVIEREKDAAGRYLLIVDIEDYH